MQLIEVPAKTGYVWFRQGIWLFRRNPLAFLTVFFAYLFAMTLISRLPLIGPVPGKNGIFAAYGYGGNGITFSYLAAR